MSNDNPYQPPSDNLPEQLKLQLQAADWQARLRKTSAVPDADFWVVVAVGTVLLLVANVIFNRLAMVLLFAWLGGSIRVCMVYSARARAALPPLNAHWLLVTSSAFCFALQTAVALVGVVVAMRFEWRPGTWVAAVFISSVALYISMFIWSIGWAKQS